MSDERRLYVLRHAKSSWDDPGQPDHDRPLAPRGRKAVKLLAEHVAARQIRPDLTLCSTARRTRDTLADIESGGDVTFEPGLYAASCADLVARLRTVPDDVRSVMVVGHNPAA